MEFLIIFAPLLLLFWFSSRQRKKQELQRQEVLNAIEIGQSVVTHSGFYGRVVDIDGGTITLESPGGVETLWSRTAVASPAEPPFEVEEEPASDEETGSEEADVEDTLGEIEVPDDAGSLVDDSGDETRSNERDT